MTWLLGTTFLFLEASVTHNRGPGAKACENGLMVVMVGDELGRLGGAVALRIRMSYFYRFLKV